MSRREDGRLRGGLSLLVLVLAAALAVGLPGVRERAALVRDKWAGEVELPWIEVAVHMAPWSLHGRARDLLGPWAQPWIGSTVDSARESGGAAYWKKPFYYGPTPVLRGFDCHLSRLEPGVISHPPTTHSDEELIVPLEGQLELVHGGAGGQAETWTETVVPGQLVYLAGGAAHTTRAPESGPVAYLVLRWTAAGVGSRLATQTFDLRPEWESLAREGGPSAKRIVLDEPTEMLGKLHVHLTRLGPGGGSAEHVDAHDVLLLTLEGELETSGERLGSGRVVFQPAGKPHSTRNTADGPTRYLVIEFHGSDA